MKVSEANEAQGVIVLVHGAFEHSGRYDWVIDQFNQQGYHVVYGDLPGHGTSNKKKGYIKNFNENIEKVEDWVQAASNYQLPIYMFGHSMGGLIVVRFLQKRKGLLDDIAGVILSSPALGMKNLPAKPLYAISKVMNKLYPTLQFPTNISPDMATRSDAYIERDLNDPLFLKKVSVRWFHSFKREIPKAYKDIKKYPSIPTVIYQSGTDLLVPKEDVKKWFDELPINEKDYVEFGSLYHEVFNEPERERVFEQAIAFLNRHH
ncbi:alpha/beta hydrolase [Halalkalibacillus halophilus]|uniref:alpha/beta hydrolase n=1 Tax=Halalkalibacillus halophilus TaxID=392827 RepID=UPI0003F7537A|nr:alpha/beta hydrolase [Halalkalibacillus halophilus]